MAYEGRALDPRLFSAARDEIRAALGADDPTTELRTAAIDLAARGLGRRGLESVFVSVCEELAGEGRDEESSLVAYVLDMVTGD